MFISSFHSTSTPVIDSFKQYFMPLSNYTITFIISLALFLSLSLSLSLVCPGRMSSFIVSQYIIIIHHGRWRRRGELQALRIGTPQKDLVKWSHETISTITDDERPGCLWSKRSSLPTAQNREMERSIRQARWAHAFISVSCFKCCRRWQRIVWK